MINRKIVYERTMTGSYMKIPASLEAGIDEKLMLRRKIPAVLPVEKAYVDGSGQYWYNISQKQSLDTYCRVRDLHMDLVEQLLISICSLLERLEWNLIQPDCLMLDPELVFIHNSSGEFCFTLYPGSSQKLEQEFQTLMEYLMKKIDHHDAQAVHAVYRIYEMTLKEGYQITDIRNALLREKNAEQRSEEAVRKEVATKSLEKRTPVEKAVHKETLEKPKTFAKDTFLQTVRLKLIDLGILWELDNEKEKAKDKDKHSWKLSKEWKPKKREKKGKAQGLTEIVYPDEPSEIQLPQMPEIHPTVCLSSVSGQLRGELRYTGSEGFSDIQLREEPMSIGYGAEADISISRETISQLHARIHKEGDAYYIEDLNSTNGTFVNEEPLAYKEQRKLMSNDIVQFADIRYRFC